MHTDRAKALRCATELNSLYEENQSKTLLRIQMGMLALSLFSTSRSRKGISLWQPGCGKTTQSNRAVMMQFHRIPLHHPIRWSYIGYQSIFWLSSRKESDSKTEPDSVETSDREKSQFFALADFHSNGESSHSSSRSTPYRKETVLKERPMPYSSEQIW